MTHRVDPKQVKQAIYQEIAELSDAHVPHSPGREGDHITIDYQDDDAICLSTAVIRNCHLDALHRLIHERAAQVGVELEDE